VRVLSRVFRGKFIDLLKQARGKGKLLGAGDDRAFEQLLDASVRQDWVVYAKPPFGGPEPVLKYLARYTHRVAISNSRLIELKDGRVSFRSRDYARGGRERTTTLEATEFLRRFLQHVLPSGFVRIRHYGFLANRHRQEKVALCRALLGAASTPEALPPGISASPDGTTRDRSRASVCPACGEGRLVIIGELPPDPLVGEGVGCFGRSPVFDSS
jgi:hypothetical protein